MNGRHRLILRLDTLVSALLASIICGSIVAFAGQVWWFPPLLATAAVCVALAWVLRSAIAGRFVALRSPIAALGLVVVALGLVQIFPLPTRLAAHLSGRDDGVHEGEAPLAGSQVISLDRPATFRWAAAALACVVVMVVASHHVDRASRLRLIWGSVIAGFGVGTFSGLLQVAGQSPAVYGVISPEYAPWWGPSMNDRLAGPNVARWREVSPGGRAESSFLVPRLEPTFAVGPHVGGPGGQLALACLALPLALGMIAHAVAPRGSREPLLVRVRQDDSGAWLGLAIPVYVAGSILHGYLGGSLLAIPVALGLTIVAAGSCWRTGNTRGVVLLALVGMCSLALGVAIGSWLGRPMGAPWVAVGRHREQLLELWKGAWRTGRDSPWFGVGLGAFGAVVPQIKRFDAASETAASALFQWWAETGLAGVFVLAAGLCWVVWNLRGAWDRVGQADRSLSAGMIGSLSAFAVFSLVHWSIQGLAISLSAAAVLGTANRWLAGGTDLFLESS